MKQLKNFRRIQKILNEQKKYTGDLRQQEMMAKKITDVVKVFNRGLAFETVSSSKESTQDIKTLASKDPFLARAIELKADPKDISDYFYKVTKLRKDRKWAEVVYTAGVDYTVVDQKKLIAKYRKNWTDGAKRIVTNQYSHSFSGRGTFIDVFANKMYVSFVYNKRPTARNSVDIDAKQYTLYIKEVQEAYIKAMNALGYDKEWDLKGISIWRGDRQMSPCLSVNRINSLPRDKVSNTDAVKYDK